MKSKEMTPMMKEYVRTKEQYKDCILFYRLGDFYEMFFEDAKIASCELDLVLTGKDCGLDKRAPMCGIPYHAVDGYLNRLVSNGHKVAICEQVEDPKLAKGLVKREVIKIVTPGTNMSAQALDESKNNYIMCIVCTADKYGISIADISTGDYLVTEVENQRKLLDEITKFTPTEIICNQSFLVSGVDIEDLKQRFGTSIYGLEDWYFDDDLCKRTLKEQFETDSLEGLGLKDYNCGVIAAGAILQYFKETQKTSLSNFTRLVPYVTGKYMVLDSSTRRNLELTETMREKNKRGSLLWVLDKTSTAMGKRMLRSWIEQPLLSSKLINQRLNAVESLVRQTVVRGDLTDELHYIADMERLMTRTVYGSATPKEIYTLAQTCEHLPVLRQQATACGCPELAELAEEIDPLEDIKARIYAAVDPDAPSTLKDGGVIAKGYHTEVDELRSIRDNTKGVLAQLEARLRQETGIPKLKIGYNHVFGYYIEVSNSYKSMVPETYIRKQTLTSGERYITQELKELESKILGAHERLITLERRLFDELLESISAQLDRIQRTANAVAKLDVLTALAQVAAENNYCRPVVDDSDELTITEGRHPVVEQVLKGSLFVPNDTTLNCGEDRCLIITGPNMAGKSTYMRQNALIALMAQIGSFVPAASCHVGVVDAIFTRIGASDDLSAGQSTFMVEMTEVAEILKNATSKSLVVLDEIGRGTSTFDGMSIARAVVEHIADPAKGLGCKTLFATHYHELTELEGTVEGVKNYNIAVKKRGEDITFLRRIVRGPADDSYGIEVAKLAGLPGSVTRRAHEVLRALEATAPKNKVEQMDFDALQEYNSPAVPSEMMDKLEALDVETLTPIEALNFLYELKKTLKGSLNR